MSDSKQCSNLLQLDIILLLVNFSFELGLMMGKYDFLEVKRVILIYVRPDSNLT